MVAALDIAKADIVELNEMAERLRAASVKTHGDEEFLRRLRQIEALDRATKLYASVVSIITGGTR